MSYRDTELDVIRWAEARSIIQHSTPLAQARKTLEEAGELLEAAAAMQALKDAGHDGLAKLFLSNYRDALGDVLVTLVVGAATADVDLVDCFKDAYNEIKDRKGHLRADGVFVKEQP
jgi:NTP pyrophosphatase (non-canonical NTP hydrolase)